MIKYFKKLTTVCKVHWKEIVALAFAMHFIFDWFVLGIGILIGLWLGDTIG
jgi:hypothetical protein